jgi:DedD protein
MELALKQRLLGAAVLVALAVIFLPMVLDGDQRTDSETVDLTIPEAPPRDFETRVVPLAPPGESASQAVSVEPDRVATVDTDAPERADAFAGTPSAPLPAPVQEAKPPDSPAVAQPTPAAPEQAPVARPAPAPAAASSQSASTSAPAARVARGRFHINLGSYAKVENVEALVATLKRSGLPVYVENVTVANAPAQRVRIGPFVDRASAERARLEARRVRPDAPGELIEIDDSGSTDAVAAPGTVTGWAVQIGAFQAEADARAQSEKLRAQGYAAFVDPVRAENGTLYRVRVGPETQRAGAERLRSALRERFRIDGLIVTHP